MADKTISRQSGLYHHLYGDLPQNKQPERVRVCNMISLLALVYALLAVAVMWGAMLAAGAAYAVFAFFAISGDMLFVGLVQSAQYVAELPYIGYLGMVCAVLFIVATWWARNQIGCWLASFVRHEIDRLCPMRTVV